MSRYGIFGGSFDPPHYGHLILADTAREHLKLDAVFLVPAAQSPLKPSGPKASNSDRLEMCRLAVGGTEGICVCTDELDRGGVSFTIDTIRGLIRRYGAWHQWVLLVGADTVEQFEVWKEPRELLQMVELGVVNRPGFRIPDFSHVARIMGEAAFQQQQRHLLPMPLIDISSTDIRQRVAECKSIRFRLPRSVEAYIETQQLYRSVMASTLMASTLSPSQADS